MNADWDNAKVICENDEYRYLLGPESDSRLNWLSAIKWCQYMGGELPSIEILIECYKNEELREEFKPYWYWSSTEFVATFAWFQDFNGGNQYYINTDLSNYVRAVRRIKL